MEIRLATQGDAAGLAAYFASNVAHFQPWEPVREVGFYSLASVAARLVEYEQQHINGSAAHFIGLVKGQVVAHCFLTNIIYGPLQGCYMGYGVAKEHEGTGVASAVCLTAMNYAFNKLGLNRIMANYMPSNIRSARLLKKLGFRKEGLAKKYLKINGTWQDHVLTSKLNPERL